MGQNKATDAAMSKRLMSYTEAILGVGEKSQSPEDLVIEPTAEEARLILERFFRAQTAETQRADPAASARDGLLALMRQAEWIGGDRDEENQENDAF